jgi:hypothetical protein
MPNFDPAQPDPAGMENQPITVPVAENQVGGFVGAPSNPDPYSAAVAAQQAAAAGDQNMQQFNAAHPGLQGNVAPPMPIVRIDEPIGISAGPEAVPPVVPENVPTPAPVGAPALRVVPRHAPASAAPATPTNPDGLMAPNPASVREPTAVEKVAAAEEERAKLQDQQAQAVAQQAEAEANAAQARADEQRRQIEEQDRLISQQRDAMVEAKRVRDAAREETKNFKFHSYWSDKSTGKKLLGGIANILGGASFDPNHVNQVTNQINNNIARDFQSQEQRLKTLQEEANAKSGDVTELARQHQEEWNKLKFKQGEQLVAVGNQFDVMALKAKGSQKVLEAKQLAQQYRATGQALIQNTEENIAKQHLTEAQTKHALAEANQANAHAAFLRAGKADAKHDKANAADDTALQKAVKEFDKQHGISGEKGVGKQISELGDALAEAKAPVQNPLTQLTTLDKLIRSATGLGVRGQVLKTYMDHLGGLRAQGESKAQAWVNGTVGKRAWQNVVNHIGEALSEKQREAQKANENFGRVFKGKAALPFAQRRQETVGALEQSLFGQMPGFGVPASAPKAPATQGRPVTLKDGRKGFLAPDGVTFTPAQ